MEKNCNPLELYILSTDLKCSSPPARVFPDGSSLLTTKSNFGGECREGSYINQEKNYASHQLLKKKKKKTGKQQSLIRILFSIKMS